ncbi:MULTISPECIES: phage holin family protein [Halomonadaceae]|uniref:Phage holin family protein n=2 Tax=Vreelandella TaxID=3137766 RepID=A0A7Z0RZY4_9GAMM|nr:MULTISPECIES: phage holin family protein [Halomonas]NYS79278.1 phage holin family protein [Halomonas glaciei]|tara:strand:- start:65 stop:502 length:438 start_codon:yes stop_codon:yes gene_type:complete
MDSDNKPTSQSSSVGTLLSTVMQEISSLVRNEAALAKTEMAEKTHQAMGAIASIAMAGAVLMGGFLTLLAALVFLLNEVLPPETTPWLSALIVGVVVSVIGVMMLKAGQKKLQARNLMPSRTMHSLQSDKTTAKQHQHNVKEELK